MRIRFVYAVDGGLFNSLTNLAHKLVSPKTYACNLCALTYGGLKEKAEWTEFIKQIKDPVEFLHRDEFLKAFPSISADLPAVFVEEGSQHKVLVTADDLNRCSDVNALITLMKDKLVAPFRDSKTK